MIARPLSGVALACALFGTALAQPPVPPKPVLSADEEKGRELLRAGKLDDAVESFRKAAKANPALPPPRVYLADLLFQAQQGQAARQSLERAALEDPEHPAMLLLNASFALGEGRITDLILSCQAALKAAESPRWDAEQRKKYQREARYGLSAGYEARRDYATQKQILGELLVAEPKNAQLRGKYGVAQFVSGKVEEAIAEFATAFKDDPTADPPELQMARLWEKRPDAAKADEWYAKAMAAHPKNAQGFREYAGWLMNTGRLDEAKAPLDAAVTLEPDARNTLALRGLFARYRRDFPTAEVAFDKMYRESPRDRFAGLSLALVLAESPEKLKQARAVELAESLVKQNERAADGYAVLGWTLYKLGRVDEAQQMLVKAASGGAVERDTAYYLGKVLFDKALGDDARKVLKEALAAPGPFVNKKEAAALAAEVEKKYPEKK